MLLLGITIYVSLVLDCLMVIYSSSPRGIDDFLWIKNSRLCFCGIIVLIRASALIEASQTKRLVNQSPVLITVGGNDFVTQLLLSVQFSRSCMILELEEF